MPNIFDMYNSKAIGAYWEEKNKTQVPFLGTSLFPATKQVGLDISWIKGKGGLSIALKPSQFDAKATFRDRIGVTRIETEMPFFREAMLIKEKERQQLVQAEKNGDEFTRPILNKIFDDVTGLVDGADVQAERMRMSLLATGGINIQANGTDYTYDYTDAEFKANNITTLTDGAKWSAVATATPVEDIEAAQAAIQAETGVKPTRAICTSKTWGYLRNNAAIKAAINAAKGVNLATNRVSDKELRAYLLEELELTVVVYDNKFIDEAGATKNYFPDDVMTLIPATALGKTVYGTTPEELDLMAGNSKADVSVVNTGVAVTTLMHEHPVNKETIVSEIVLPSFETIGQIHILNV